MSADELEEIDIGSRDRPRPMYVSARLDPEYKQEVVDLLNEFRVFLLGNTMRCLVQIDQLLNIGCQPNLDIGHLNKL